MLTKRLIQIAVGMMALTGAAYSAPQLSAQAIEHATEAQASNSASATFQWKSPAQLHRLFPLSKVRGTLFLDVSGVEFVSDSGQRQKWTALDFETFTIKPHKLVLHTYHDRGLGRLGEDSKEFNLAESVPPSVAAWLAGYAGRPSRNAVPAAVPISTWLPFIIAPYSGARAEFYDSGRGESTTSRTCQGAAGVGGGKIFRLCPSRTLTFCMSSDTRIRSLSI